MARFLKFKKNLKETSTSGPAKERFENTEPLREFTSEDVDATSQEKSHRIKEFLEEGDLKKLESSSASSSVHEAQLEKKVHGLLIGQN